MKINLLLFIYVLFGSINFNCQNTTSQASSPPVVLNTPGSNPTSGSGSQLLPTMQNLAGNYVSNFKIPGIVISIKQGINSPISAAATYPGFPLLGAGSQFKVGSITKTFTSALILKLMDQGRLNIDVAIPYFGGLTTRMLLNHTGGTGDYLSNQYVSTTNSYGSASSLALNYPTMVWTFNELLNLSVNTSLPGLFNYSNTGYLIAGRVAEATQLVYDNVGTPKLQNLLSTNIFLPLGLTSTLYQEQLAYPSTLAIGFDVQNSGIEGDVTVVDPSIFNSAGAVITNANDLHNFIHAVFHGAVLSQNSFADMINLIPANATLGYAGLGIFSKPSALGTEYYNDGAVPGYLSHFSYYVSLDASIVILVNTYTIPNSTDAMTQAISDLENLIK
jgi:D-alanyl-D-alanine carboxypeptidase